MAAATIAEYFRTSYRPDCEFVDGLVVERNVGEYDHSTVMGNAVCAIGAKSDEWRCEAVFTLRVQVAEHRCRVPDVVVLSLDAPREQIIMHPPLLCIEVLSPADRMSEMMERVDDHLAFGVKCVWILDPRRRTASLCTSAASIEFTESIGAPGTPIEIPVAALFEGLLK